MITSSMSSSAKQNERMQNIAKVWIVFVLPDAVDYAPKHAHASHRKDTMKSMWASVFVNFVFVFIFAVRLLLILSFGWYVSVACVAERKSMNVSLSLSLGIALSAVYNMNAASTTTSPRVGYKQTTTHEYSQLFWNVRAVKTESQSIVFEKNKINS